jgi:hypothetical protein
MTRDFQNARAAANDVLAAAKAYTDAQLANWIGRVRVSVDGAPDVAARHRLDFLGGVPVVDDPTRDRLRIGPLGGSAFVGAHVFSIVTQNLTTGVPNTLHFEEEVLTSGSGIHDNVTNNNRLTIPVDGIYAIWGFGRCSNESLVANAGMCVDIAWRSTGVALAAQDAPLLPSPVGPNTMGHACVFAVRPMTAGEYVSLRVWHNTGHTEHTTPDQYATEFGGGTPAGAAEWPFDAIQFALWKIG